MTAQKTLTSRKAGKAKETHNRLRNHIKVLITGNSEGRSAPGEIQVEFWSEKERMLRALKFGGMCWGAALLSVLIPLLHFILVPSFLLAGPILAFFVLKQESIVLGGKGTCPECKEELPIAATSYRFPISDLCTKCQSNVRIYRADKA